MLSTQRILTKSNRQVNSSVELVQQDDCAATLKEVSDDGLRVSFLFPCLLG